MPTYSERLETAVALVETDSTKLHSIVHGAYNAADVVTEGGNVKTAAKVIYEAQQSLTSAVGALQESASASAAAASVSASASLTSANNASTYATAASVSASAASASASAASDSASSASASAGTATAAASAASGSASAASASQTSAGSYASLSQQWATKTDGSVDGTNYSAKYYALQVAELIVNGSGTGQFNYVDVTIANGRLLMGTNSSVSGGSELDLTLAGGSSGASLVLGQGANGAITLTPKGTGSVYLKDAARFGAETNTATVFEIRRNAATVGGFYTGSSRFNLFGGASAAEHLYIDGSGNVGITATTASISTTTGSLINAGGFGNAGKGYFGGAVTVETSADIQGYFKAKTGFNGGVTIDTTDAGNAAGLRLASNGNNSWGMFSNLAGSDNIAWYSYNATVPGVKFSITKDGVATVAATAASTSTTTGSLINAGGFGNAGAAWIGGKLVVQGADGVRIEESGGTFAYLTTQSTRAGSGGIFSLNMQGKDSGAAEQLYAQMTAGIDDSTAGSEDGYIKFTTINAGSFVDSLLLNASGATFTVDVTVQKAVPILTVQSSTVGGNATLRLQNTTSTYWDLIEDAANGGRFVIGSNGTNYATWTSGVGSTLSILATTASTSTTTGSLINAGGFGNAGAAYIGGDISAGGDVSLASNGKSLYFNAATGSDVNRLAWKYTGTAYAWIERLHATGALSFGVQSAERMSLTDTALSLTGNLTLSAAAATLGIGDTATIGKLHIFGSQTDSAQFLARFQGKNSSAQIKALDFKLTAGTPQFLITTGSEGTDANLALGSGAYTNIVLTPDGLTTVNQNLALTSASATITMGSTNTATIAGDASGGLTVTPKAGQPVTVAGNLTASGTGSHVFGTTNTVTLSGGAVTATGQVQASKVRVGSSTIGASANPAFTALATNGEYGLGFQGSANGAIRAGIKHTIALNLGGLDFMVGGDNNTDAAITALSLSSTGAATFASSVTANGSSMNVGDGGSFDINALTGDTNSTGIRFYAGTSRQTLGMKIAGNGYVGVGAETPEYPLQVRRAGGAGSLGITIDDATGVGLRTTKYYAIGDATNVTTGHAFYTRNGTDTDNFVMGITSGGNVGIGSTGPTSKLHVKTVGTANQNTDVLTLDNIPTSTANGNGTGILFRTTYNDGGGTTPTNAARIFTELTNGSPSAEYGSLHLQSMRSGTLTTAMTLTGAGNVLIGTTTDSSNGKLQLATHSTKAGGFGFGPSLSLYQVTSGKLELVTTADVEMSFRLNRTAGAYQVLWENYMASNSTSLRWFASGADKFVLDIAGNATFSGNTLKTSYLTLRTDTIEEHLTASDNAAVAISWNGYNGGTSYYRSFVVYNGKNTANLIVDGATGDGTFRGRATAVGWTTGHSTLTYATSVDVSMISEGLRTVTMTGNITFSLTNKAAGRAVTVRVINDSPATNNLTFNANWRFVTTKPATIAPNKLGLLKLTAYGTADTDVVAEWLVES